MTVQKSEHRHAALPDPPPATESPAVETGGVPAPSASIVVSSPTKSGRGVAWFALLIGLGAAGSNGALWALWQQEQARAHTEQAQRIDDAIKKALARQEPEIQTLKTQVQELQTLRASIDQARNDAHALREQFLGLTGDLQPLKNAVGLHKGENEVIRSEIKLLREGHEAYKTLNQQQQTAVDKELHQQQAVLAALQEQLENLKLAQAGLAAELDAVRTVAAKGGDVNAFPLAEVDYLLRLAETKLKVERNIDTARLALDAAQQRLRPIREAGINRIQTMVGEAIASLRGVQLPDIAALAHKLLEMEKRVARLPLRLDSGIPDIRERIKPATAVKVGSDPDRSWWERSLQAVWDQFKDIVVIRRQQIEAPPLIARENEFFLRQNLVMEMDAMRLALLRGDAESYQAAYQTVCDWTQTYYDVADPKVAQFLAELQALQAVQFHPYIPDLTGVRQAFQEFLAVRQPLRALRPASGLGVTAESTSSPSLPSAPPETPRAASSPEELPPGETPQ